MTLVGHATKDVLHAFLRALRAVLVTAVVVFIVVALAVEVIASFLTYPTTHSIIPGGLTHLVAAALGVAFAYAAAITVAI